MDVSTDEFKIQNPDNLVLIKLENLIGKKIPNVYEVKPDTFGFVFRNKRVIQLGLPRSGLSSFPEDIFLLKSLETLSLGYNQLTSIMRHSKALVYS